MSEVSERLIVLLMFLLFVAAGAFSPTDECLHIDIAYAAADVVFYDIII